ncbi:hypothetical protein L484_005177 [Morus notabilis]|uniref:Uncharacterized protein n=1 Tax=Morus notabilis TaxID=981085 RepID=W9QLH7_9ROSA|nr:hypothetical protein L484_005177 [Morus notabilis]
MPKPISKKSLIMTSTLGLPKTSNQQRLKPQKKTDGFGDLDEREDPEETAFDDDVTVAAAAVAVGWACGGAGADRSEGATGCL